jgi:hypothetical protein
VRVLICVRWPSFLVSASSPEDAAVGFLGVYL